MAKAIVLYNHPVDAAAFDRHFSEVHTPIVKRFPRLQSIHINDGAVTTPDGSQPYHLVVELNFATMDDLRAAVLESPEGKQAADDLANFAQAGVSLIYFNTQQA